MPKDFCHPQRPFHQALQEVFQWKKNSPLPSLQAWEGCTAFLTVSNEIPYYCFSPGRLQKSCKLHRAHMSINLKQKTSKEINCSSPISIWHSLPFFWWGEFVCLLNRADKLNELLSPALFHVLRHSEIKHSNSQSDLLSAQYLGEIRNKPSSFKHVKHVQEYFLRASYCVFAATAKHNNRDGALGYEMGSGHIFKASCWVPNTFENLASDSLVPFQKEISLRWQLANQLWKSFCTVISVKHKSRSPAFSAWLSTVTNHYAALRYTWNIPR